MHIECVADEIREECDNLDLERLLHCYDAKHYYTLNYIRTLKQFLLCFSNDEF